MTPETQNTVPDAPVDVDALRQSVARDFPDILERLIQLVAIPGIAWEAFDPAQLQRSAEAVAGLVRAAGVEDVQILRVNKD